MLVREQISQQERVDLLAHVPLFSELSQREMRKLAGAAIQREYPAGTTIVTQGETGVGLYILIAGRVLVWQRLPDGTDRQLARLGTGEMFGEMALLDTFPRSASALAQEATSALVIPIFDFRALLHGDSAIAIKLLAVLSRRVRLAESAER
jgi:CRP/FNR family cyclic AMP-dependent transcriptional regulator